MAMHQVRNIQVGPDASGRNWVVMFELDNGHSALVSFEQIASIVEDVKRRVSAGESPEHG